VRQLDASCIARVEAIGTDLVTADSGWPVRWRLRERPHDSVKVR